MTKLRPTSMTTPDGLQVGHAVVIGIANYRQINVLPDSVSNDARDIANVLTSPQYCGYREQDVELLLDGDATLQRIRNALRRIANVSGTEDTALVFFSGHGAVLGEPDNPMSAILPVDCDARALGDTGLCEPEFSEALRNIRARRMIVLLDACYSGGASSLKDPTRPRSVAWGYSEKSLGRLAEGKGRVVIASSRPNETSLVLTGQRNSVFSGQLLEALRGQGRTSGDGLIRVFDIFNHVSETVKRKVPGRQHPIFKASDLEDNFPVALNRGGAKTASSETTGGTTKEIWEQMVDIMCDLYPLGPVDQEIWCRAGGDPARIRLTGTGRECWYRALHTLRQGGGGTGLSVTRLVSAALEDYPHHPELVAVRGLPEMSG